MIPNLPAVVTVSPLEEKICLLDEKWTLAVERRVTRSEDRLLRINRRIHAFRQQVLDRIPEHRELVDLFRELADLQREAFPELPPVRSEHERLTREQMEERNREGTRRKEEVEKELREANVNLHARERDRSARCKRLYRKIALITHPDRARHKLLVDYLEEARRLYKLLDLESLTAMHEMLVSFGRNIRSAIKLRNEARRRAALARLGKARAEFASIKSQEVYQSYKTSKGRPEAVDIAGVQQRMRHDLNHAKRSVNQILVAIGRAPKYDLQEPTTFRLTTHHTSTYVYSR